MYISSKDNANIKLYRRLAADKRARAQEGLFTVEGMRSCIDTAREAAAGNVKIKAFFYTAEALERYSSSLPTYYFDDINEKKKFEIAPQLAAKMSDEPTDQGVFIIAHRLDRIFSEEAIDPRGKYLVLNNLQDPGNLGTLIRTADAMGVSGVVMTNSCCDLYNPKVVRSAMGSMPRIDLFIENDFENVCRVFSQCGIRLAAAWVNGGISAAEYDFSQPCAVVIGNEGRGLTRDHADMCHAKVTIKMHGNIDSLNAASAGTIILWEMTRRGACSHE